MTTTRAAIEQALAAGPTDKGAVMADVSVEARERMKTEYIREDRTVEGWYIETHYTPCKGIADANGYLRVLVDEEGYDTETRILHETLNGIGWVKSAAISANNQERAAGTAGPLPAAFECLDNLDQEVDGGWSEAARHDLRKLRPLLRMIEMEGLAATSTTPADEGAAVKEVHMPHRCIKPHCPADCSGCNHTISGRDEVRNLICDMLDEFANDGHGATFEDGEHPLVDRARAYLFRANAEFEPLYATPQPPTAEPVDSAYPFYELKFIMRVLGHKGGAPKQDWDTAYGMAREIFSRWHKDRQSTAEGQPNRDWDHIDDVLPVIELMRSGKWVWGENMRCKYVEVRIDTRDGGCIIKDRHDVRITPAELVKQFDGRGGLSWTEYDEIFSPPIAKQQEPS